ncbi:hypothetical protein ABID22_003580 [Pontibacter aydingkolensis]|uniref:Uncharacterized protein n=1 Tax=Pontibacter aydingkolensis TaxID=1911536 RepID=A0ABS7CYD4_9BACT|nr:hypothetical protein [Pontibacter aydingkolensis]MBW7468873.1 hypothetical protein [Pontibacter aydingkolensis]
MIRSTVTKWVFAIMLFLLAFGAQAQTQSQLEKDLAAFRSWMQTKASLADSTIRKEWPTVKKEYRELTCSLDQNTRKMSDKSRQEYGEMKADYKEWEERNETRQPVSLDGKKLAHWEKIMTGTTRIASIKPANLRDAFVLALDVTREHRRTWNLSDWEYAEFVVGELNTRKAEVLDKLNNSDKIKIAALQVEFATLKKSKEAKDKYQEMREGKR